MEVISKDALMEVLKAAAMISLPYACEAQEKLITINRTVLGIMRYVETVDYWEVDDLPETKKGKAIFSVDVWEGEQT